MIVGFPPFHCADNNKLYRRIMTGTLRFPPKMDPDAKDLIAWLLSKNPDDRPSEFSEIKSHPYFIDIHWGRFTKKEAIPPWIPDLYTFHAPKLASLKQVFHENTLFKEEKRSSHNARQRQDKEFKRDLNVHDKNSNRLKFMTGSKIESSIEDMLHLEGKFLLQYINITKLLIFCTYIFYFFIIIHIGF